MKPTDEERKIADRVFNAMLKLGCCDEPEEKPCQNRQPALIAKALHDYGAKRGKEGIEKALKALEESYPVFAVAHKRIKNLLDGEKNDTKR